jgi:hypothetical protein
MNRHARIKAALSAKRRMGLAWRGIAGAGSPKPGWKTRRFSAEKDGFSKKAVDLEKKTKEILEG